MLAFPFAEVMELVEFNAANNQARAYDFDESPSQEELNKVRNLHLVGDHGVYLMSGTVEQMPPKKKKDKKQPIMHIVYAKGCDPDKDKDYYWKKRDEFGGDDGVESIPVSIIKTIAKHLIEASIPFNKALFCVEMNEDVMSYTCRVKE